MEASAAIGQLGSMSRSSKLANEGTFARWVQDIRHAKRLSQEEFAEALGVSRTSVASWETGAGYARQKQHERLRAMALAAGLPTAPHLSNDEEGASAPSSSTEGTLLRLFRQLGAAEQVKVVAQVAELLVREAHKTS